MSSLVSSKPTFTRIAFQVSSSIDSRTILNTNGAENLLGKGDMLFMPPGTSRLTRVHGAFVTEEEIHQIVEFIGEQQQPQYLDPKVLSSEQDDVDGDEEPSDMDPMYEEAIRVVARDGRAVQVIFSVDFHWATIELHVSSTRWREMDWLAPAAEPNPERLIRQCCRGVSQSLGCSPKNSELLLGVLGCGVDGT